MAEDAAPMAEGRVEDYYDERVAGKLRDFTHPNPRIEAAIELIAEWAPAAPRRVLEIGCGVGATSWRMARAWPDAEVIGSDISPQSIEVAQACFRRPNLRYVNGPLAQSVPAAAFDLVVMMDVYEHIRPSHRPDLHTAIAARLSDDSRFILTVPTPTLQGWGRKEHPEGQQPVDEDIGPGEILSLATDTQTRPLYYREVGIWRYGDYFHLVLGRFEALATVAARQPTPEGAAALKHIAKRVLGRAPETPGRRDYLGADVLRAAPGDLQQKFQLPLAERRALAAAWLARGSRAGSAGEQTRPDDAKRVGMTR